MEPDELLSSAGFLAYLAAAALLWVVFFRLHCALAKRFPRGEPLRLPEGLLYFAAALLLVNLAGPVLVALLHPPGKEGPRGTPGEAFAGRLLVVTVVEAAVCLAALGLTFRRRGAAGLGSTGLRAVNPFRGLFFTASGYVAFFPAYAVVCFLVKALVGRFRNQDIVQWFLDYPRFFNDLPVLLSAAVIIPACEEILFRGYLLSGLRFFVGPVPAVLLSALIFGLVHEVQAALPVFALGCMLGYLRERTGSLWPCFLMHGGHNALMLFLAAHPP